MLKGYNTDMDGFLEPIKKRYIQIEGEKILLLGAGGAARAIVAGMAKEKAGNLDIVNRTTLNANNLAEFATKLGLKTNIKKIEEANNHIENYDIIINSTSIGLKNEVSPISFEEANQKTIVYDIVYAPMNTDFIKKAKERKLEVIYGYEMLLGQATRAFEIWHEMKAPYNAMKKALLGGF
jgi:shikimate dehydrogenase